ncbi:pyruvate formate lyase activating enzyme [Marinobacter daqiaonensis]|uniref:Pyruvate formate lyase activating enzyme n=1 Tax=Marinobacter daqiaonensis TaxID=650891 RepID=A0A1I6HTN5_9GAMM|nr:hypothetical protein [Marinobacter daqiaonensis]SFR57610.1 pyruvate formate lyase activating enzyme [Marinobacter daqiaonensis]
MTGTTPQQVPTRCWHGLDDGRIQCDLCPRHGKLKEGQQGLCFVRARHDDQVVLTTWGRSSGFCIDPVETKPLNNFLPGVIEAQPGRWGRKRRPIAIRAA